MRSAGLTEYAAHLIFCFRPGTQNPVGGPLLTLYITFISHGPRGTWIMNRQNVYDLSNDRSLATALPLHVDTRESRTPNSPTVPAVDPDFLSGHSHSPYTRAGFRDLPKCVLNGRTGGGTGTRAILQAVVTARRGTFWWGCSRGCPVDMGT